MNCQEYDALIDDYVDGTLDDGLPAACDAHLATCAPCRALTTDLQTIRTVTLTLEPHVPSPQVWYRLSAAIDAEPRAFSSGWFTGWRQAIAATAMSALLVAGLAWIGARLVPVAQDHNRVALVASRTLESSPGDTDLSRAEQPYTTAIAGLEDITRSERSTLDTDTADVLQANLKVIDGAIGESRAALEKEPESNVAQESLFEALRNKVALLQDTVALINEMRQGNAEGAARIVSGQNQ